MDSVDVGIDSTMLEYKCDDQVAKVFLQWFYDQGCRPNVFPPTHRRSRKHSLEEDVFYLPPRCAKFTRIVVLNKELWGINQQPSYVDYFHYGFWFII
jgi:hypothetical protein